MKSEVQIEEELREALLNLERSWETEKLLKEEYSGLVECLHTMAGQSSVNALLSTVVQQIKGIIGFSEAVILRCEQQKNYRGFIATKEELKKVIIPCTGILKKAIKGRPISLYDISQAEEWRGVETVSMRFSSALYMLIFGGQPKLILVCLHRDPNFFTQAHGNFLKNLAPSISQALTNLTTKQRLVESEREYRILIDGAKEGIAIIAGTNFLYINSSITRITGFSQQDLKGKDVFQLFGPEEGKRLQEIFIKETRSNENEVFETRVKNTQGQQKFLEFTLTRIKYKGAPANLLFLRDITEKKELQLQLIQSQKLESIGQLAAGVAHEINNPVGFVASNCYTLRSYLNNIKEIINLYRSSKDDRLIEEKEKEYDLDYILEDIESLSEENIKGLERITTIVQSLKDFAHIEAEDSFNFTDINKAIESTLLIARNEFKYSAEISMELGDIPEIYCNISQLNQVFLNLIVNAAQAIRSQNRQDMGRIFIRTYGDDSNVYCDISDDGPGIRPENLSKIFDPFFTTKDVGVGTGLGLNISYDIVVNKHGGDIQVRSEPDKGASFILKLPVRKEMFSQDG